MVKAILFDFDGTLMDTTDVIIKSWQHTFRTIEGKERDEAEIRKTFGEVIEDTMKEFFPQKSFDECIEIYRSYQRNIFAGSIKPYPGMKELVKEIHDRGIKLAVVSSRTRKSLIDSLKLNGMYEYFQVLVTCEDTKIHKPKPEPAFIAMEKLGIGCDECIMIGDTRYDIGCAANAGIKSVLVSWTVSMDKEEIGEMSPDYIVNSAEEILDLC